MMPYKKRNPIKPNLSFHKVGAESGGSFGGMAQPPIIYFDRKSCTMEQREQSTSQEEESKEIRSRSAKELGDGKKVK